jgi:A/G-specific adenine glycosylase
MLRGMPQLSDPITSLNKLVAAGPPSAQAFRRFILSYFKKHGRDFPWRRTRDPYKILVSEVMLQQTQTERVVVKYAEFLKTFPTWKALSAATPAEVVRMWMGLGYYRRAFNLHKAAKSVITECGGKPPRSADALKRLPGVGPYTAAALAAFAFGEAVPMIETNIRAVYLHVFYPDASEVSDKEILEKVAETMCRRDPRTWFYALMDLGVALKKHTKGINKRSKHHVKQSKFQGSHRQVRAAVLKLVVSRDKIQRDDLFEFLVYDRTKVEKALLDLESEGLIAVGRSGRVSIV